MKIEIHKSKISHIHFGIVLFLTMICQVAIAQQPVICYATAGSPLQHEGDGKCSGRMEYSVSLGHLHKDLSLNYFSDAGFVGGDFGIRNWMLNIMNQSQTIKYEIENKTRHFIRFGNGYVADLKPSSSESDYYYITGKLRQIVPDYFKNLKAGKFAQYGVVTNPVDSLSSTYYYEYGATYINGYSWAILDSIRNIETGDEIEFSLGGIAVNKNRPGEYAPTRYQEKDGFIKYPDGTKITSSAKWVKNEEGAWKRHLTLENGENSALFIKTINDVLESITIKEKGKKTDYYLFKYISPHYYDQTKHERPEYVAALLSEVKSSDLKLTVMYDKMNRVTYMTEAKNGGDPFTVRNIYSKIGNFYYVETHHQDGMSSWQKFNEDRYLVETKTYQFNDPDTALSSVKYNYDEDKRLKSIITPVLKTYVLYSSTSPNEVVGYNTYKVNASGDVVNVNKVSELKTNLGQQEKVQITGLDEVKLDSVAVTWRNSFPYLPSKIENNNELLEFSYSYGEKDYSNGIRKTTIKKTDKNDFLYEKQVFLGQQLIEHWDYSLPTGYQVTEYKYDNDGRLIQRNFGKGEIEKYDKEGRTIYTKNYLGEVTELTYNSKDQLQKEEKIFPSGIEQTKTFSQAEKKPGEPGGYSKTVTTSTGNKMQTEILWSYEKGMDFEINGELAWKSEE
jgi:YD repeat-containing protein